MNCWNSGSQEDVEAVLRPRRAWLGSCCRRESSWPGACVRTSDERQAKWAEGMGGNSHGDTAGMGTQGSSRALGKGVKEVMR